MDPASLERRIQTVCLLTLAAVAAGGALYWLRPVMIPFVLAVFLALAIAPLVELQMRFLRMPRPVAILSTLGVALLAMGAVILLVSTSVSELAENAERYQNQLELLLRSVREALPLTAFGIGVDGATRALSEIPVGAVGSLLLGTTNAIMNTLSQSLLVLVFVVYLLIGARETRPSGGISGEIRARVQRYLIYKAIFSAATGVLVATTLALLGIDLALVFGLFAFLLNFIPNVGSLIATLLPLPIVMVSPDVSAPVAVLAIAIPGAIQFTLGNVIEPKVMGDSLDLHPIAILMALIVWGMLWGVVGMLLATPITAVLKILFEKLEQTRPLANLLAGRVSS